VETPRKFHTANYYIDIFAVLNLRGVSTNKSIICFIAMQTYKELISKFINKLFRKFAFSFDLT
jgi:hypothetical protein